jgi:hypothetical protein
MQGATIQNTELTEIVAYGHSIKPKGGSSHQHHLQGAKMAKTVAHGHPENSKGGISHQRHSQSPQKNPYSRGKANSVPYRKKTTPMQQ